MDAITFVKNLDGAEAFLTQLGNGVAPNYAVIEAIVDNEDGSRTVTTDHGNRLVTILADAHVMPFRTRNIVTLQDLCVGDAVVLYYDIMTLSIPAQAATETVVLLLSAEADETVL